MAEYGDMTVEELEAEQTRLHAEARAVQARRGEVAAVLDKRRTAEAAQRRVEGLSDPERAALAQALGVPGIQAGSQVGTPGA